MPNRCPRQQPWRPSWISDRNDFGSFFFIYVILMLPTKFRVMICLSVQEKKRKIDFQDGSYGGHLRLPIRMILAILIYSSHRCFLSNFKTIGVLFQEKKRKIYFQDGVHGRHFGFPIGTILAIFYLQVTLMLPTEFHINWPFVSDERAKNRFSSWCHGDHLGFCIRTS